MEPDPTFLAKITKPRLPQNILPRPRLFRLLDEGRGCPVTWISGPGGSGKTTLIAGYIEKHRLPCIWYQMDEGDSDIATFFYYLRLTGRQVAPDRPELPFFSPEYASGTSTFTKRFFEGLFDRLQKPGAIVLDNYQAILPESPLHGLMRDVCSVIPPGANAFILSRSEPPASLSRARASNLLHEISWPALRLEQQETRELARLLSSRAPEELKDKLNIDELHKKTAGWVAGLVLLLNRSEREGVPATPITPDTTEAVADYFASEIFNKASVRMQDFVLATSFFPNMSPEMARSLTGAADSDRILSRLRRGHWFTERFSYKASSRYQYHPLFLDYLRDRASRTYSGNELKALKNAAAGILEADGQYEPAVELFFESADFDAALRLILDQAPMMVIQGRMQTLAQWLQRLPAEIIAKDPHVLYWLGMSRHHMDPDEGRAYFEKSFAIFKDRKETNGKSLALCGLLDAISYRFETFKPLDRWIPELTPLSRQFEKLPTWEAKGRLAASALFALTFRQPDHPEFKTWEERGMAALKADAPEHIKLQVIIAITWERLFTGELAEAGFFIDIFQQAAKNYDIPPYAICALKNMSAFYHFLSGRFDPCCQVAAEALDLAAETGVHFLSPLVLGHEASGAISSGDLEHADRKLCRMIQYNNSSEWIYVYHYTLSIWKALLEKDIPKACLNAERACEHTKKSGMVLTEAATYQGAALARHLAGETAKAQKRLDQAFFISIQSGARQIEFGCHLTRAEFALNAGDEASARDALGKALSLGEASQYTHTWFWRPDAMARLCCEALEAEIKVDYVQSLVRNRKLIPEHPPLEIENWPWPIRIYTLGRFSLMIEDKPLRFNGKTQEKPLELLKAVIASGGRNVSDNRIADQLWAEAEGDAAQGAFKTTLHRLRKLLGHHGAIHHNAGRITLDSRYCWVDAWAFARRLSKAEAAWQAAGDEQELREAADLTRKALKLYKGRLFQSEDNKVISLRDHLHYRFIQALQQLAAYWQNRSEMEKAIALYESGLKIDGEVEIFYRGLMRCNHHLGRQAAALKTYKRCKKALAQNLNMQPSTETVTLKNFILKHSHPSHLNGHPPA